MMKKLSKSIVTALAVLLMTATVPFAACAQTPAPPPGPGPVLPPEEIKPPVLDDPDKQDPVYDGSAVKVSEIVSKDFGNHIKVGGQDFLFVGTQIRVDALMNCDKLDYGKIELLFAEAAKLGVTCVQIPVEWAKMEIAQDVFDYTYLYKMMTFANKYDLKMEFLWYGTNMCGDTHSYTVPDYILRDGRTYPKFDALRTGEFWNFYGIMWYLDFDNENLIARETNAVEKMMEYIYEYDSTHGAKKPVIGIQILNEPDIFVRYRIGKYNVLSRETGQTMTAEEGYTKVCNSLNALGKAVKKSNYQVYTRVNLAGSTKGDNQNSSGNGVYDGAEVKDAPAFATRMQALEGIDIIGDDCYMSGVKNVKGITSMYAEKIPNNFGHVAENDGNYANTASLILAAVSQHGGYSIYDLLTSPFYVANDAADIDQGIIKYADDTYGAFTYKNHYTQVQSLIAGLKAVDFEVYDLDNDDFICFNVASDYAEQEIAQTISSTNVTVAFSTSAGALGFALDMGGHLDVYVTADATLSLSNGTISAVKSGVYTDGAFNGNAVSVQNGTVRLTPNMLYRIEYNSAGKIQSTTWDNIGG